MPIQQRQLLEALPLNYLHRTAFGVVRGVQYLPLDQIQVRDQDDYLDALADVEQYPDCYDDEDAEPIGVVLERGVYWLERGHRRYVTAECRGDHDILVDLKIRDNPVKVLLAMLNKHTASTDDFKQPTKEMVLFLKKRTKDHIDGVVRHMKALEGFDDFSADELDERAREHDKDKYADSDLVLPYIWVTEYHRVNNSEGSVDDELQEMYDLANKATGKHVKQNLHHPEAHAALDDMTPLDLAEMVCDWSAMAEEMDEGSARGWADKNIGSKWKFSADQKEFIYATIDWLEKESKQRDAATLDRSKLPTINYRGQRYAQRVKR